MRTVDKLFTENPLIYLGEDQKAKVELRAMRPDSKGPPWEIAATFKNQEIWGDDIQQMINHLQLAFTAGQLP